MTSTFIFGLVRLLNSMLCTLTFVKCIAKHTHIVSFRYLKHLTFLMAMWELCSGLYYISPNIEMSILFARINYAIAPIAAVALFLFSFSYTFPNKTKAIEKLHYLYILPVSSGLAFFLTPHTKWYLTVNPVEMYLPFREAEFIVHTGLVIIGITSYIFIVAGLGFLIYKVFQPNTVNKSECIMTIIASVLFIFANVHDVFFKVEYSIIFTPLSIAICILVLYLTLRSDKVETIIAKGQENILGKIPSPIFFLNNKNAIIYSNVSAKEYCPYLKNTMVNHNKDIIFDYFEEYKLEEYLMSIKDDYGLILKNIKTHELFYYQEEEIILKAHNKNIGKIIILFTISTIKDYFFNLEKRAFKDSLCDVYNRHYLQMIKKNLEDKKITPMSVIVCDIDGLKAVNDSLGHDVGDEYIVMCSTVIKNHVRSSDYVFRTGGDEFLILLPFTTLENAEKISKQIQLKINILGDGKKYSTSLSVGCAEYNSSAKSFDAVVKLADEAMYQNKKTKKIKSIN